MRDGKPYAPRRLEEFQLLPGVKGAVTKLHDAGFLVVVVTNQPDIANGLVAHEVVEAMHARLRARVPVDAIEVCPHGQHDECACRKPKPGLLVGAAQRLSIDLEQSFLVGDRWKDIVAGREVGCYTVFVDRGYQEAKPVEADAVARSLPEATRVILEVAAHRHSLEGARWGGWKHFG